MNRLKFLVFALVALGLWGYHLAQVSPVLSEQGQARASAAVAAAPHAVALKLEAQRSELQAAMLKLAASPAAWNAGPKPGAKVEPPAIDRFAAVRPVVVDALSAPNKDAVVIALVNEAGALVAQGSAEPGPAPEGFALPPLVEAGAAGSIATFNGAPTLFYAAPLLVSDKNEVRAGGAVLVGLPLLPNAAALTALLAPQGLEGLALVADGKVLVSAGESVEAVMKALKANSTGAVSSGAVRAFGPLELPILAGTPAITAGARQAIAGTPFEVVASASSMGALQALASYQVFALGGLAALLLLTIVVGVLVGGHDDEGARMVIPPPMPVPPSPARRDEPPAPVTLPAAAHEPAPEASPDDFDFPMSGPSQISGGSTGQAPAFQPPPPPEPEAPAADPFASMAPPPPPAPSYPPARPPPAPVPSSPSSVRPASTSKPPAAKPPPPVTPFDDEDEGARTVAYPAFKPPTGAAPPPAPISDPFAMAASQMSPSESASSSYDDNPDATRVAAVPQELIKQARSGAGGSTGERPVIRPPGGTASVPKVQSVAPVVGSSDEDRHFQDVFRDFVSTREKCGEPADGLTFEKFKAKLLKNKEQLVAKYACRTVRFQVYVKDGKAALKATPVKD